jgi:hypothetical protein
MNLNLTLKKLQRAILSTGLVVKIGTSQFYSPEQERMITMWILSTPTLQETRNGWRMRDYEILRTASAVEAVKCLADIWEQTKGWKDERNIIPSEADR